MNEPTIEEVIAEMRVATREDAINPLDAQDWVEALRAIAKRHAEERQVLEGLYAHIDHIMWLCDPRIFESALFKRRAVEAIAALDKARALGIGPGGVKP